MEGDDSIGGINIGGLMNIHLLRHGIAAPLAEENDFRDEKRRLTPEGELKLRRAAQGLKLLQVSFDLIVSSPLIRAKETAEIVAEVIKYKPAIDIWDELEPEGTAESVCSRLRPHLEKGSLLLVGHQPSIGVLASYLLTGSSSRSLPFKKGSIFSLEMTELPPASIGNLNWMLSSRMLRQIAGL
jgi:phosphohistidine phosphatase